MPDKILYTMTELDQLVIGKLERIFTAVAITVIHKNQVLINNTWGGIPFTQLFDLASLTKLFTVTAFLSLVSQEKIGLDDPIVRIIPEFGAASPKPIDGGQDPHTRAALPIADGLHGKIIDPEQVTFRHLLTHTAGLAPWRAVYRAAGPPPVAPGQVDPISRQDRWTKVLIAICNAPFVGVPGDKVRYSDLGLMLLGEAVARLYGADLKIAIQERITQPLQLDNITFLPAQLKQTVPTEADTTWRQRRCWGEVHDENACGAGGVAGHAGLFGSAQDIAGFGQAWLRSDARLDISPHLMSNATQEQAETDGMRRGLGWMLKSHKDSAAGQLLSPKTYGHTGFTGTSLYIDPTRELVIALLTNRIYMGRHVTGIHAFRQAVHDWIAEKIT